MSGDGEGPAGPRSARPFGPTDDQPDLDGGAGDDLGADTVEELIDEALVDVEAARPADRAVEEALAQSTEEAVSEAVDLARRFEAERDEYLDLLRRVQAEFENYKRRVESQREEQRAQAAVDLVRELLPVLDAGEAALAAGHDDVGPVHRQLLGTLEKQGLRVVADAEVPFDPNVHEAVLHEEGDGDPVVAEVMRSGYLWNSRVVRAAMVKVRG